MVKTLSLSLSLSLSLPLSLSLTISLKSCVEFIGPSNCESKSKVMQYFGKVRHNSAPSPFALNMLFGCSRHSVIVQLELVKHDFRIRLRCLFIFAVFKTHTKGSNALCVSAPTTTIQATTVSIYHGLSWFRSRDIRAANQHIRKYCKTFDYFQTKTTMFDNE